MCKVLNVSTNSYYTWLRTKDIPKENIEVQYLKERIQTIFEQSNQIYGSVRVCEMLKREDLKYHRSYIALLMKEMGLRSVLSRKFKVCTTNSNHSFQIAENVLDRNFETEKIGHKWVSDITYIRIKNQWNYVTTIIDLADRKVLAFIFHQNRKITQSMSRKGNCWDNAVAESFFKTLKYECTNRYQFDSFLKAHKVIDQYIKWYNYKRIHSAIQYKTPAEKEIELRIINNKKIA